MDNRQLTGNKSSKAPKKRAKQGKPKSAKLLKKPKPEAEMIEEDDE